MNEVVIKALKEQPILIPRILFKYYKKLNVTEEELILLICILNKGTKIVYDPNIFNIEIDMEKYRAMELITNLAEKGIIEIKVEDNESGKKEEYIYLDPLYNKMLNLLIDLELGNSNMINTNVFSVFEQELGRTLSAMEVEIIREWLHNDISEELIKEAIKEAVLNNVRNLKYIERILHSWRTKGFKTKEDILKDKKNYRKQAKKVEQIYDYNWLEDE